MLSTSKTRQQFDQKRRELGLQDAPDEIYRSHLGRNYYAYRTYFPLVTSNDSYCKFILPKTQQSPNLKLKQCRMMMRACLGAKVFAKVHPPARTGLEEFPELP